MAACLRFTVARCSGFLTALAIFTRLCDAAFPQQIVRSVRDLWDQIRTPDDHVARPCPSRSMTLANESCQEGRFAVFEADDNCVSKLSWLLQSLLFYSTQSTPPIFMSAVLHGGCRRRGSSWHWAVDILVGGRLPWGVVPREESGLRHSGRWKVGYGIRVEGKWVMAFR